MLIEKFKQASCDYICVMLIRGFIQGGASCDSISVMLIRGFIQGGGTLGFTHLDLFTLLLHVQHTN